MIIRVREVLKRTLVHNSESCFSPLITFQSSKSTQWLSPWLTRHWIGALAGSQCYALEADNTLTVPLSTQKYNKPPAKSQENKKFQG